MTNKMRLGLIVMAFVVLALSSIACNDPITPGDGQVGEAVLEAHGTIQDTADDIRDAVNATGEGIDIPTEHGTVIIDSLWDKAFDIMEGE